MAELNVPVPVCLEEPLTVAQVYALLQNSGNGQKQGNGACFICGKPDHWSRDCPQNQNGRGG
jgi:hypothetical protein